MQRRAAAAYFVLFMVISAGAYAYLGMAEQPQIDVPGETYAVDDELTVGDQTYTVDSISNGSGSLTWGTSDARYTATLANNSTVSWQAVSWEDQRIDSTTLENGTTVEFDGSDHQVLTNVSADPPTMRLVNTTNRSMVSTVERGGTVTLAVDGQPYLDATLTDVTAQDATLRWGSDYLVTIPNETGVDPTTASLIQQQNVTRILGMDTDVRGTLGTNPDGSQFVEFENGTQVLLSEYLPDPEVETLEEGGTLQYQGNETTIGNITTAEVPLEWRGPKTFTRSLSEGSSVELNNETYFVHFPSDSTVKILENTTENYEAYQSDQNKIDKYNERKAGLWAVVIISLLAGLILLATAYLPVRD
ncbi:hypothetical protein [Halapricum salinum]|uniref:Uncharacterized protein n=1 Tax=Halapricum salinum TaxID=1457250 RepID=A0A4D6HAP6_9EURY|nr:hypothetical protein [Halapricum salinum]QCC50890.1 hypothetical protein DV733_06360 [Halapricum salinum]